MDKKKVTASCRKMVGHTYDEQFDYMKSEGYDMNTDAIGTTLLMQLSNYDINQAKERLEVIAAAHYIGLIDLEEYKEEMFKVMLLVYGVGSLLTANLDQLGNNMKDGQDAMWQWMSEHSGKGKQFAQRINQLIPQLAHAAGLKEVKE